MILANGINYPDDPEYDRLAIQNREDDEANDCPYCGNDIFYQGHKLDCTAPGPLADAIEDAVDDLLP